MTCRKYIIGADGGKSTVRRESGIAFNGQRSGNKWIRIDVSCLHVGCVNSGVRSDEQRFPHDRPPLRQICLLQEPSTQSKATRMALYSGAPLIRARSESATSSAKTLYRNTVKTVSLAKSLWLKPKRPSRLSLSSSRSLTGSPSTYVHVFGRSTYLLYEANAWGTDAGYRTSNGREVHRRTCHSCW